jgi:hypothetical protein
VLTIPQAKEEATEDVKRLYELAVAYEPRT